MKLGKMAITVLVLWGFALVHSQAAHKGTAAPAGNRDRENVQAVAKLEDEMRIAALKGTAAWWVEHLSDAYTGSDAQGKVSNKEQTVEFQRSTDLVYDTWNLSE